MVEEKGGIQEITHIEIEEQYEKTYAPYWNRLHRKFEKIPRILANKGKLLRMALEECLKDKKRLEYMKQILNTDRLMVFLEKGWKRFYFAIIITQPGGNDYVIF